MNKALLIVALLVGCGGSMATPEQDAAAAQVAQVDAGSQCPEGTELNACGKAGTCNALCLEGPLGGLPADCGETSCVHEMLMIKDNGCCQ